MKVYDPNDAKMLDFIAHARTSIWETWNSLGIFWGKASTPNDCHFPSHSSHSLRAQTPPAAHIHIPTSWIILGPMFFKGKYSLITMSEESVAVLVKSPHVDQEQFVANRPFFLAVTYSGTSFPVLHFLLSELKRMNSKLGRLGLSVALIGDILSVFLMTILQGLIAGPLQGDSKEVLQHLGKAVLFLVLVFFCLRPLLKWMVRCTVEGGKIKDAYLYTGPPLGSALVEKLDPVVSRFLMPLFAATCGMRINFSHLKETTHLAEHQAIAALATILAKFGVSFLLSFLSSIVPMLVKALYDPSRSCIHVPANVNSIIHILNASCPTRNSPIALHVLHLIKLSGRATPLFISHEKNWNTDSDGLYSENVVLTFNQFERDNWGTVLVKAFTASPCSVGILVEGQRHLNYHTQSSLENSSSYTIAMIFLGGKDDREALALGRRISQDKSIRPTIIHIRAANGIVADDTDIMHDEEMLRNITNSHMYTTYIEKLVNNGPETLEFLRSIVDNYQLFIVRRR
ncbi:hypothetical protein F3Y22_tig00110202pilonHSYRG00105 [Hibiscus syriacus]|uniref:Cation/H+ exchanger transmembrane domain-containing protein n=1 Tax=Hibiscus syriacus TaxID=106335 RepID=A0A6A3BAN4_HIBSY|nr:hypothetical protein F3Y22_tig00110202pilonHSYRG00105 [Hibiscus syriacus]